MSLKQSLFIIIVLAIVAVLVFQSNNKKMETAITQSNTIHIDPIFHASLILEWDSIHIYVDPVDQDKKDLFNGKPDADIILITDIHGDHFDTEVLKQISKEKTTIIAPQAVADMMTDVLKSKVMVMNNGEKKDLDGFTIEAIPMYNLPGPNEKYHTKGRGNGYVIEKNGERVYISGDTAGIPEMRVLENIDIAFICMNLPYTMDPAEAASTVLDFKPKNVYPYHYRQHPTNDYADVAKFKELVQAANNEINVVQLDWYPKQ